MLIKINVDPNHRAEVFMFGSLVVRFLFLLTCTPFYCYSRNRLYFIPGPVSV